MDNLQCVSLPGVFFVFMWGHHFPKLQISNPTEGVVSSDTRHYQTLYRGHLNFQVYALRDIKWRPEKDLALVKRAVIAYVFC